jgi:hypothetical protein
MFKPSSEALEWLRNYHGSIDSTALLLAFEAGRRALAPPGVRASIAVSGCECASIAACWCDFNKCPPCAASRDEPHTCASEQDRRDFALEGKADHE